MAVYTPAFSTLQQTFYEMAALVCSIRKGCCAETCEFRVTGVPHDDDEKILVLLSHRQAGNEQHDGWVKLGIFDRVMVINPEITASVERAVPKLVEQHEAVH